MKKLLYFIVINVIRASLKLFYGLKVYGRENFPKGPALICANHISYLDPPIVASSAPEDLHFLARDSLFNNKMFGWFISTLNSHPVKPSKQDAGAFKMVLKCLKEGHKVLIFPEGGRSSDGKLAPLKNGPSMLALHSGVPIVPVYVHGSYEVWPKNEKKPKLSGKLISYIGKPIYPDVVKDLPKKEAQNKLTEILQEEMLKLQEKK